MRELKNSRTVITMSLKFEMYVHEAQWKGLDGNGKNLLNAIIHSYEEQLQKKAIEVIRDRLELANPALREQLLLKALADIRVGGSIKHLPDSPPFLPNSAPLFTLSALDSLIHAL
jgi:hypothetical protein